MDLAEKQAKIDAISWYHDFDFGNGLKAQSKTDDAEWHHRLTLFIRQELERFDFRGKTVLDIGCWDGYWSFYAERRGAAAVLASDDFTQNWSNAEGIFLAKQLLGSAVEVIPDLSVYSLTSLKRKFDIILCLGVYYHLWDPFFAFAQIRHCCHRDTVLLLEGNVTTRLSPNGIYLSSSVAVSKFTPTIEALKEMLVATYFRPESTVFINPQEATTPETQLPPPHPVNRVFIQCIPHEGPNNSHIYRPPFGLHAYDSRFHASVLARYSRF
jgi:tRNA (mo5U34)-methyltransferase